VCKLFIWFEGRSPKISITRWSVHVSLTGRNYEQFRWYWPWHLIIIYKFDQIDEGNFRTSSFKQVACLILYVICSRHDIVEILLKLALSTNQSINQSGKHWNYRMSYRTHGVIYTNTVPFISSAAPQAGMIRPAPEMKSHTFNVYVTHTRLGSFVIPTKTCRVVVLGCGCKRSAHTPNYYYIERRKREADNR
jgi:hypothetical protein